MSLPRWIERMLDAIARRPNLVLLAGVLLAAGAILFARSRLEMQTGRSQMISPDEPFYREYDEFKQQFSNEEFLVVLLEIEDRARAEAAMLDLMGSLELAIGQDVRAVFYRKGLDFFRERGLLYADAETFRKARAYIARLGEIAREPGLESMFQRIETGMEEADESNFGEEDLRFLEVLLGELERTLRGGSPSLAAMNPSLEPEADPLADYFTTPDGKYLLAYIVPLERTTDLVEARTALEIVRGAILQTRPRFPGQEIALTGRPAVDADEMSTTQTDMTRATILSFAGVALLFFLQFHSSVRTAAALFSLVAAITWTFGVAAIWPGRLTLLSIVFAAILVGLGIDFGVYLLTRFELERHRFATAQEAIRSAVGKSIRPIFVGAFTTALAFGTSLFVEFPGIAEMGASSPASGSSCASPRP